MPSVPLDSIRPSKQPVRPTRTDCVEFEELVRSMDTLGQLSPVIICGDLVDGHRRLKAAQRLGWKELNTLEAQLTPKEILVTQITMNKLTIEEYRMAIFRLIDENSLDTLDSVCYTLGMNVGWVSETLGLDTLAPVIRAAVNSGKIHTRVAVLLAKLPKGRQRELLTDSIEIPVSDLLPGLQREIRHRWENSLDTRTLKRRDPKSPWLRTERGILNEINDPHDAMRIITKQNATTAFEGWNLALQWVLRLDTESFENRNK